MHDKLCIISLNPFLSPLFLSQKLGKCPLSIFLGFSSTLPCTKAHTLVTLTPWSVPYIVLQSTWRVLPSSEHNPLWGDFLGGLAALLVCLGVYYLLLEDRLCQEWCSTPRAKSCNWITGSANLIKFVEWKMNYEMNECMSGVKASQIMMTIT